MKTIGLITAAMLFGIAAANAQGSGAKGDIGSGSGMSGAANTQCWDTSANMARNKDGMTSGSAGMTTGAAGSPSTGATTGLNTATPKSNAPTGSGSTAAGGAATARPAGMANC